MVTKSEAIYNAQGARASELGISGSPDVAINDVELQVGRSPEAVKKVICDSFITAPSECSQTLSTSQASAWFGSSDVPAETEHSSGSC